MLNQFRPILLCNILAKVVTKILANRLKPLMTELMGLHQSSFIPGRSTTDNITVVQEAIHTLRSKKSRTGGGGFILKIDLEKVYDRVDWEFLKKVLKFTGFKAESISLIMDCVTSARLSDMLEW